MTDNTALRRYQKHRDPDAFALLVDRYQEMVYGVCLRTLRNATDAEDAAQDTFLKLARHAEAIQSSLGGWLQRTATTTCLDRIRRRDSQDRRAREWARLQRGTEATRWAELQPLVDEAMLELDEAHRALIVDRYLRSQTLQQLASRHGTSVPTMSRRSA
ncbi:MAG: sigma-70 family RNA polymerase sigma factor [Planctomycetota bacterium]